MSLYDDVSEHTSARSSYAGLSPSPEPTFDVPDAPRPNLPPLATSIAPRPSTALLHNSPDHLSPASAIDANPTLFNAHRRASLPILHHHQPSSSSSFHSFASPPQSASPVSHHSPHPWASVPGAQYYDPFPPGQAPTPSGLPHDPSPASFPFSLPHSPNYELTGAYTHPSLDHKFHPPHVLPPAAQQHPQRDHMQQQYHQEWHNASDASYSSSTASSPTATRSFLPQQQLQQPHQLPFSKRSNSPKVASQGRPAVMIPLKPPVPPPIKRRGKLPKNTTDLLKSWLHEHTDHPYPSEDEKKTLCAETGLTMNQVSNWMINARRRILAPAKNGGHVLNPNNPANAGLLPAPSTNSVPGPVPPRDLLATSPATPAYLSGINNPNRPPVVRSMSMGNTSSSEYTSPPFPAPPYSQQPHHLPSVSVYASNASLPESNASYAFGLGGGGTPVNYHGNMGSSMLSRSIIDAPRQAGGYNIAPIGIRRLSRDEPLPPLPPQPAGSPSPFAYNVSASPTPSTNVHAGSNSFRPPSSSGLVGLGVNMNSLTPISRSPSVGASPAA